LDEVPDETVFMIGGFIPCPMKWLSGVVLLVSFERKISHCCEGIREIVKYSGCDWVGFAFISFDGKH
jgi:hypothetical protein